MITPDEMTQMHKFAIQCSFGQRVTMSIKEHRRPRTQKKWNKRYGYVQFTIPGTVFEMGHKAVAASIREARAGALEITAKGLPI